MMFPKSGLRNVLFCLETCNVYIVAWSWLMQRDTAWWCDRASKLQNALEPWRPAYSKQPKSFISFFPPSAHSDCNQRICWAIRISFLLNEMIVPLPKRSGTHLPNKQTTDPAGWFAPADIGKGPCMKSDPSPALRDVLCTTWVLQGPKLPCAPAK